MSELGAPFRATKDLDIVLIIEALDSTFGKTFWKFINSIALPTQATHHFQK
jgi:hypothetical protein